MPIVAVAGALIAGAIAAPAVGGLIAGAGLSLMGGLEITAAIGATLGAVGAVTRDKGLQTAGLVIGGIGGIGSLASAAGLIDGSTSLFGAASSGASDIGSAVDVTASPAGFGGEAAGGLSAAEASAAGLPAGAMSPEGFAENDIVGSILHATQTPAQEVDATAGLSSTPPSLMTQADQAAQGQPAALSGNAPLMAQAQAANAPTLAIPPPTPNNLMNAGAPAFLTPGEFSTGSSGILGFAKDNPLASYGLIQAGGSLVSGMFSTLTPAQVAQANAVAANNRAQAALTAQQASNIKSGVPGVTRIPAQVRGAVTGAPNPNGTGMINTANPSAYAVTGVPS